MTPAKQPEPLAGILKRCAFYSSFDMISRNEASEGEGMEDVAIARANKTVFRSLEFYAFCAVSFTGKSILLIGLPYREWPVNTVYTCSLLLFVYCFFRFRQGLKAPILVILSLAMAVAVDVLGNKFGFYGHPFGPLRDYDEFAHFFGSGFSSVAAFWLLRAGTRRMGFKLSTGLLGFLATSVAFAYCGWYEILELWDEYWWSHFERIHWWYDTANDLFYDFIGVIAFIALIALIFKLRERRESNNLIRVRWTGLFSALPKPFLAFLIATLTFGLCCWFEIFVMFDQQWFGRIHLVGNRDTAIKLQWELAACALVAIAVAAISRIPKHRKEFAD
jgi:uncharacterized membrane protein YjdF